MATKNCIIKGVGFKFHPKGQKEILHWTSDVFEDLFSFVPEDDNPHDEFAVALYFNNVKAGYVSREDAPGVRRFLEDNEKFRTSVIEIDLSDDRTRIFAISFSLAA